MVGAGSRQGLRTGFGSAALLLWFASALYAVPRSPTLHDLDIGYSGSTLSVSPDGAMIAVESNDHLLVLGYPRGRIIADLGEGWQPQWSPVGDRLAFYSLSDDRLQLFTWSREHASKRLTNFAGGINPDFGSRFLGLVTDALQYSWSPDARTIAVASRTHVTVSTGVATAPLVLTNTTNPDLTWAGVCILPSVCATDIRLSGRNLIEEPVNARNPLVSQLYLVDVATGSSRQLTMMDRVYYDPVWTADGLGLLAISFKPTNGVADIGEAFSSRGAAPESQIVALDPATGSVTRLVEHVGAARQLTATGDPDKWIFATSPEYVVAPHLEIASLRKGATRLLPLSITIDAVKKSRAGDAVISYRQDAQVHIADVTADGAGLNERLTTELGTVAWEEDASGGLAWIDQRKNVMVLGRRSQSPVAIFGFGNSDVSWSDGAIVTWRNSRGEALKGGMLLPENYVPGRRYPVIVDAYPLAHPDGWMHSLYGNQAWAAAGYVVFMPGERAPHVWMNATRPSFGAEGKGPNGFEVALDDVMSGVNELVRQGLVDPNRMCLYGHSNGGGAVSYLVTMTHRFKCAVVVSPAMADWVRSAILITDGRERVSAGSGGMDFNRDIRGFIRMSAVFQLYKARTPMLIASGDNDTALVDAISVYNAVRDTGTPVTFVRYPGQGHLLTGAAMDDFWSRELAFFAEYLHPDIPAHN